MIINDYHENRGFDYEGTHYIIPKMLNAYGVTTESDNLSVGDYLLAGPTISVVVSSKTASDFIGSISDGHLNNELLDMSNSYSKSVLMIHGSIIDALIYRKMTRQAYAAFLASCVIKTSPEGKRGSISVINFSNVSDAVQLLKTMHDEIVGDDIYREPTALRVKFSEEKKRLLAVQYMLKPAGVGPKRAKEIKERFKTIRGITEATPEQFMEIPGIGKKIAEGIRELVNEE